MFIEAKSKGLVQVDMSQDVFLQDQRVAEASYDALKGEFTSVGCTFERCSFRSIRANRFAFASGASQTRFVECAFDGSRFKHIIAGNVRFERCTFMGVDFRELFGHAAEFVDCVFSGKLATSAFFGRVTGTFEGLSSRKTNEFRNNDFLAMTFEDVDFRGGIDLAQQRLPTGQGYMYLPEARVALQRLRETLLRMPPSGLREAVFVRLKIMEETERDGQRDLFLVRNRKPWPTREAEDFIWQELKS